MFAACMFTHWCWALKTALWGRRQGPGPWWRQVSAAEGCELRVGWGWREAAVTPPPHCRTGCCRSFPSSRCSDYCSRSLQQNQQYLLHRQQLWKNLMFLFVKHFCKQEETILEHSLMSWRQVSRLETCFYGFCFIHKCIFLQNMLNESVNVYQEKT